MARMSDPQMVEAFMASRTWPGPGSGSGRSRISVVELPGRKTPRMPGPRLLCSLADEGGRSDPRIVGPPPYRPGGAGPTWAGVNLRRSTRDHFAPWMASSVLVAPSAELLRPNSTSVPMLVNSEENPDAVAGVT